MIQCAAGRKPEDSLPLVAEVFSFLQLFSECLGVDCISLDDLQCMCSGDVVRSDSAIQEVCLKLLSPPRKKKISAVEWKEAAVKFGAAQCIVHPQARYDRLSYRQRTLILKRLCEHYMDRNEKIRDEVKRLGPDAFRMSCPLGLDAQGNNYWMLEDHTSQAILFAEKPCGGAPRNYTHCVAVARNLDEIAAVLEHLRAQVVQTLRDKPSMTAALLDNERGKSVMGNPPCVVCAERIKKGAEVLTCCQCYCCSHTECVQMPVHPTDRWFCPYCSFTQQKHLISSIHEKLERLVPAHQRHLKVKESTQKQLKRLAFFYGGDAFHPVDLRQSRLRTRRDVNYSEVSAKVEYPVEEEYPMASDDSSSEEQSVESGEEDVQILSRRGQRYQRLLEKRNTSRSAANCMDEKENTHPG